MCLYCPHRCLLSTVIASWTQDFKWKEQGYPSNVSLCAQQTCSSCSHRRHTYTDLDLTDCSCPGVWGLNTTSIPRQQRHFMLSPLRKGAKKDTTIFCIENILYCEGTRGDLFACFCEPGRANSQAQVEEPTLPIACPVILQPLEREHKATFTGTVLYFTFFFSLL